MSSDKWTYDDIEVEHRRDETWLMKENGKMINKLVPAHTVYRIGCQLFDTMEEAKRNIDSRNKVHDLPRIKVIGLTHD